MVKVIGRLPFLLASVKIFCTFHRHPVQNSVRDATARMYGGEQTDETAGMICLNQDVGDGGRIVFHGVDSVD